MGHPSPLTFAKLHGAGNDFVLFDARRRRLGISLSRLARYACARRAAVGADGILVIERDRTCDFALRYLNADGSEAELCGNGGRCAAWYARHTRIAPAVMRFRTPAGVHRARATRAGAALEMPAPRGLRLNRPLDGVPMPVNTVVTGVPHAVVFVPEIASAPLAELGPFIRNHPDLAPDGANVDFVQLLEPGRLAVRTFERGVESETLSCGTGATAVAVVAAALGFARSPVGCRFPGGELVVRFDRSGDAFREVFLEGPVVLSFVGKLGRPGRGPD